MRQYEIHMMYMSCRDSTGNDDEAMSRDNASGMDGLDSGGNKVVAG